MLKNAFTVIVRFCQTLWNSPNNIAGFLQSVVIGFLKKPAIYWLHKDGIRVRVIVYGEGIWNWSVGNTIVLSDSGYSGCIATNYGNERVITVMSRTLKHEYGHTLQARILGPLFLFVVGIPSMIHAWTWLKLGRKWEYHRFFTEAWADRLGNVRR